MSFINLKNNRHIRVILPILLIFIIISAFYVGKQQGSYPTKIQPSISNVYKEKVVRALIEGVGYDISTTTITLPTNGYSTKVTLVQPVRSSAELSKHAESFDGAYPYYEYYIKDVEQYGDIARRYIDKSLGISDVRKFDVDMDGKDETLITLCDYVANGCPHKFIIVKDNRIIFSIDQGYRHLNLVKSQSGNGFTVHWTPIIGTEEEMSYCCPTAHMETTFIFKNGTFKPISEKKVHNSERTRDDDAPMDGTVACENYKEIQVFDKPVNIVWVAKLDGCLLSCSGAYFTVISGESKYSRFNGYLKDFDSIAQEYLDADVLKVYGKWTSVSDDYAKSIFGNRCVPTVEIDKIEIIK